MDAGRADASGRDGGADGPSVRAKFVGNITTNGAVRSDFIRYWDQITPENEGKWGSVEATRGMMNWTGLDAVYNYAQQNGIPFKEHALVWGSQQPSWISGLSAAEQAAEVEEWIRLFCERYPNVALIDVVNEPPPHTTPAYMDAIGGAGSTGYDWIIWSFQKARQYCPKAILILNDYNILRWADADNFIKIANAVKGSGYIDALGSQSHGQETQTLGDLQTRLNNLIAVGLPIYISEYDVSTQDDAQQQMIMEQQVSLFWNTPEIKGITLWGYVYGSTWSQAPHSGLIRNDMPRPAMTWLMNLVGR
jgi:endo-1,4-beta-xylanase